MSVNLLKTSSLGLSMASLHFVDEETGALNKEIAQSQ